MAKPKFPKKSNDVQEIAANSGVPPMADAGVALTETSVTISAPDTRKMETRKSARKPEIVKTEGRANLVPINVEEEVRRLAYLLSERRGFEPGHEAEDWLAAEREIRQRYRQQSA